MAEDFLGTVNEGQRVSKRQVLRETKIHWRTLEKIFTHSASPGLDAPDSHPGGQRGKLPAA